MSPEQLYQAENRALSALLKSALRQTADNLPPSLTTGTDASGGLQILDLGCGPCREAGTLVETFREISGRENAPVRFVGADIRARELEEAALRARAANVTGAEFEFVTENCALLNRHRQLGSEFDITFLRHQNYWNDAPVWRRIFEQGLAKLKDDGLLVITSYFDKEHALAVQALQQAGAELLISQRNPDSAPVPGTPGKSVDRHLAVFRKKR